MPLCLPYKTSHRQLMAFPRRESNMQAVATSATRTQANPRLGYMYAVLNAIISGFAVYINNQGVNLFKDSTLYTTLKNGVTGVLLLVPFLLLANQRAELRRLTTRQWRWLVLLAVVWGSVPYALFFWGLQHSDAATGSLLNHVQFIFVAILAVFLLRERLGPVIWLAVPILLAGTALTLNFHQWRWNEGSLMVLLSTVLFAVGVVLAKYLLGSISPLTVMTAKMSIGSLMLFVYVGLTGHLGGVTHLSLTQWEYVVGTGVILLAFTVTAIMALRHASATATSAIPAAA